MKDHGIGVGEHACHVQRETVIMSLATTVGGGDETHHECLAFLAVLIHFSTFILQITSDSVYQKKELHCLLIMVYD